MTTASWHADPLTWGTGPRIFEAFLEPTCPYSVRAFNKLEELLSQAGEDKITVKIRLQSQPWHMYSGVLVRCIIAASTLEGGKQTAKKVMAAVAAHREEFEFERHACRRPVHTPRNSRERRRQHRPPWSTKAAFSEAVGATIPSTKPNLPPSPPS